MRVLLGLTAALAMISAMVACDNGNGDPDDIPRTVPPTSVQSGAERPKVRQLIRGSGPIYET